MGRVGFDFDVISGPTPARRVEPLAGTGSSVPPQDPLASSDAEMSREAPPELQPTAATVPTS
jgi:hypothetical protein